MTPSPTCFNVVAASRPAPLVVEVPHAGTDMVEQALRFRQVPMWAIEAGAIEADADLGADLIWEGSEARGIPRVVATASRYLIDLNTPPRFPTPYEEKMPEPLNNLRRRSACGSCWSAAPLPRAEIERRVAAYLEPYHQAIAEQLELARVASSTVLLSSHTFPDGRAVPSDIDVVIGTARETSAPAALRSRIADVFRGAGLQVALETPFPGGLSLARHGRPADGVNAVQVEVRRSLLARTIQDGDTLRFALEPTGVARLRTLMIEVSQAIVAWASERPVATSAPRAVAGVSP